MCAYGCAMEKDQKRVVASSHNQKQATRQFGTDTPDSHTLLL